MADLDRPLIFADSTPTRQRLSRALVRGDVVRLARGIYTTETTRAPDGVVRKYIWAILAHEMPGAVLTDRSVEDGGTGSSGVVYVVATRARALTLPGLTVLPRPGAGQVEGDIPLPGGIWIAGEARSLLDNLAPSRPNRLGLRRTAGRAWVERRLDRLCAGRGVGELNRLRDEARGIAEALGRQAQLATLDRLIGAALSTRSATGLSTPELRSRAAGTPFDPNRLEVFRRLASTLSDLAPTPINDPPQDVDRRTLRPFFEAYFSNDIEGTEFTLDEAAAVVFDGVDVGRPADAHDVFGTYQLTSSVEVMRTVPRSGAELVELLRSRHRVLMAGRPEVSPGQLKTRANRAGSTEFVAPELVEGTLLRGFEASVGLVDPFARATFLMFLVTEVHPFADGNGRTARILMNSELVSAGQVPIIIPTVFRANYLAALTAVTQARGDMALVSVLQFAQRWTARVDWGTRERAEADLTRTNALRDSSEAEQAGVRLLLP